jgi:4,5-epoxidase
MSPLPLTTSDPAVLVVGAGPTGLALACGLRRAGVEVRVVDRAGGPAVTSRALGLQPRGAEVLDRLGALGDLPDRSLEIGQVVVPGGGRELGRLAVGRPTPLVRRPGLLVSQTEVERALRARFAELGGVIEWGREVLTVDGRPDGVDVRLGGASTVHARWVVGCDGAHSRVRTGAGIEFPGVPLVERFLLADVHADLGLPRDAVAVWLRGEEMVAAFPLPGDDLWRVMAPAPHASPAETPVLDVLVDLLASHLGHRPTVRGCDWTSTFRIHRRLAATYRRGRVLLAGDAAHIHSPFGGQGLNTGIGDAENLAWKLTMVDRGRAGEALLDSYAAERRPVAEEVLASTSSVTGLVMGASRPARLVRDHVFVPLMNRPLVQRLIWEQASQLKVSYRTGPLARAQPRVPRIPLRPGPRPGDRVPDWPCTDEHGRGTRLHAELGDRWVVLAPPGPAGDAWAAAARRSLGPEQVTRLVAAAAGRRVLLVRPDAHLGWSGRRPEDLARWVSRALHRTSRADRSPLPAGTPEGALRG